MPELTDAPAPRKSACWVVRLTPTERTKASRERVRSSLSGIVTAAAAFAALEESSHQVTSMPERVSRLSSFPYRSKNALIERRISRGEFTSLLCACRLLDKLSPHLARSDEM